MRETEAQRLRRLNRESRRMMREISRWMDEYVPPAPFDRGAIVSVSGQPYEVVMQKGTTVYVKDETGKVTAADVINVTAL